MITKLTANSETSVLPRKSVQSVRRRLDVHLPATRVQSVAEMFAAFGDATRLKLLLALSQGELCVGDLADVLGVSASAVSHQLRGLRALRLVRGRRDGKMTFYSLDDDHVQLLLDVGLEHARESHQVRSRGASQQNKKSNDSAAQKVRRTAPGTGRSSRARVSVSQNRRTKEVKQE
jgi:ArsR family transcriptional regulator